MKEDGSVVAWGNNEHRQSDVPAAAQSGVRAVAAGGHNSLALKEDGSIVAWGSSGQGTVPAGLVEAEAVAAGYGHNLAIEVPTPTGPVDLFEADAGEGRASLSWSNPTDPDFRKVRVLRSTVGPATGPKPDADQVQVYEGRRESFVDTGLENGTTYYYTAYATDDAGLWSARATERATPADVAVPDAPAITSPINGSYDADGFIVVRGTAEPGLLVRLYEGTTRAGTDEADPLSGAWRIVVGEVPDGPHTYKARATDAAGNTSTFSAARRVVVDSVRPRGTVQINGGSASTASRSVTLTLTVDDPLPSSTVSQMRFRNEKTATWSPWRAMSGTTSWTLSSRSGTKKVYVRFRDRAGNVSATSRDAIAYKP